MLDGHLFQNARWDELHSFFTQGNPPLILVLLGMNTLVILFLRIRNSKSRYRMRPVTSFVVQSSLIAANFFVMFQNEIISALFAIKRLI